MKWVLVPLLTVNASVLSPVDSASAQAQLTQVPQSTVPAIPSSGGGQSSEMLKAFHSIYQDAVKTAITEVDKRLRQKPREQVVYVHINPAFVPKMDGAEMDPAARQSMQTKQAIHHPIIQQHYVQSLETQQPTLQAPYAQPLVVQPPVPQGSYAQPLVAQPSVPQAPQSQPLVAQPWVIQPSVLQGHDTQPIQKVLTLPIILHDPTHHKKVSIVSVAAEMRIGIITFALLQLSLQSTQPATPLAAKKPSRCNQIVFVVPSDKPTSTRRHGHGRFRRYATTYEESVMKAPTRRSAFAVNPNLSSGMALNQSTRQNGLPAGTVNSGGMPINSPVPFQSGSLYGNNPGGQQPTLNNPSMGINSVYNPAVAYTNQLPQMGNASAGNPSSNNAFGILPSQPDGLPLCRPVPSQQMASNAGMALTSGQNGSSIGATAAPMGLTLPQTAPYTAQTGLSPPMGTGQQFAPLTSTGQQYAPSASTGQQFTPPASTGQQFTPSASNGQQLAPPVNIGQQSGLSLPTQIGAGQPLGLAFPPQTNAGQQSGLSLPMQIGSGQQYAPLGNTGQQYASLGNTGQQSAPLGNTGQQYAPLGNTGQQLIPLGNAGQQFTPLRNAGQQSTPLGQTGQQFAPSSQANAGQQLGFVPLVSNGQQLGLALPGNTGQQSGWQTGLSLQNNMGPQYGLSLPPQTGGFMPIQITSPQQGGISNNSLFGNSPYADTEVGVPLSTSVETEVAPSASSTASAPSATTETENAASTAAETASTQETQK
ncbi:hypothetical protein PSACC_00617 [Paramicrosporidium saccamoebae]|uniref:Uncharacterized protein n=1 Tax=Paramicrosporidium saccamoebae TaxID=1246581 RepID=A0A2H9TP95_9FUNG|nr:hypothetical protein PSACC_00617 [Paramicrosporidium saccamoebae]